MIAFVKGILDSVSEDKIIVENQNIGFEILVPGSVVSELPQVGNTVKIYTYTYVREDALQLYGFLTKDSMDMFKLLITVNGIGPKAALGILTAMDTDALRLAILSDDAKTIAKAPGIGPKTASKLILELKDKISLADTLGEQSAMVSAGAADSKTNANRAEAIEALTALGFSASEAVKAVSGVKDIETLSTEAIIKAALKKTL